MEKLKALFKNKKIVAGTIAVLLLAIVGVAFALNQPQKKNEVVQQETISDAEYKKLVAKMKELQEADKIAQAKSEEDKKIAEEKAKAEAEAKAKEEAEKKAEEEKQKEVKEKEDAEKKTHPVQPQPEKKVQTVEKPVEKPKPIKYCEYNGPRKHVQNICNNGDPWATVNTGRDPNSYIVRKWVQRYNNGEVNHIVFKGETDRYHLITTPELREGLEKATDETASCYINGSCIGFRVP